MSTLNAEIEIFPKSVPVFYFDNYGDRIYIGRMVVNGVNDTNGLDVEQAYIDPEFHQLLEKSDNFPIIADIRAGLITQIQVMLSSKSEQFDTPVETDGDTENDN